jgi:uncharacterized protein YkwD
MKSSFFRTFFTLILTTVLSLSYVNGQKNKKIVNKSISVHKSKIKIKPTPPGKTITKDVPVSVTTPITSTNNSTSSNFIVSPKVKAILEEINSLRDNPQKYIEYLQEYRKFFKGNMVYLPNEPAVETIEGISAIDECIAFLKTATKMPPYTLSKGLSDAANLQLKDLMSDASIVHIGKDGSNLSQRLAKFGFVGNSFAENISFFAKTPRDIVLNMLIDDGIKTRSHRKNLFSSTFKIIGLGFGIDKNGKVFCVAEFADSFREK